MMNLIKCNASFDLILYPLFCSSAVFFVKHYPLCLLWMQFFENIFLLRLKRTVKITEYEWLSKGIWFQLTSSSLKKKEKRGDVRERNRFVQTTVASLFSHITPTHLALHNTQGALQLPALYYSVFPNKEWTVKYRWRRKCLKMLRLWWLS